MKMYVIVEDYYNGMQKDWAFCGIFSTYDMAKRMIEEMCSEDTANLRDEFDVDDESSIQMIIETPNKPGVISETTIRFKTYGCFGYVKYSIIESEVDQEIKE